MIRYVARRLLAAVPLVVGVATVTFFLVHIAPGDVASRMIVPGVPPEVVERVRTDLGLDRPLPVQYLHWLGSMLRLDFGYAYSYGLPVSDLLLSALPNTLLLSGLALVGAFALGICVGVVQAVRRGTALDSGLNVVVLFFYSMPSFWLATVMVLVFAVYAPTVWDWPIAFPPSGARSPAYPTLSPGERLLDRLWHLVLPVATLTLVATAGVARFMRSSMLEVIRQDYVRTARAKGLSERRVVFGHALRNGLMPIVTLLGLYLPVLLSGTVFVEAVFDWPGMGRLLVRAIVREDIPVVMAGTLLFASIVVVGNLLSDVLYALVDPRVRVGDDPGG